MPGLWLPFLADDWANLAAVSDGVPAGTPFGYFRPIYLALFRLEWLAWGLSPALFHLAGLIVLAATAALVAILAGRYTRDARVALLAGAFFALHPHHVDNAAWIAARADSLGGCSPWPPRSPSTDGVAPGRGFPGRRSSCSRRRSSARNRPWACR